MSWNPDDSVVAWAAGPWVFRRARLVCALLGHRWMTKAALYGPKHTEHIPWAGGCQRCGVTLEADDPRLPLSAAPSREGEGE